MPCNHKFQQDLNLTRLDFKPVTLIVGTFNPEWPEGNQAQWFYGRTHDQYGNRNNSFWDVLPRLYGEPSLLNAGPDEWKRFCSRHKIALTDLVSSIQDANQPQHNAVMGGYADNVIANDFHQHTFTDIVGLLQSHRTIKNVYLTRGEGQFWTNLWTPVVLHAAQKGLHENKLLTPSKNARFSMFAYDRGNPLQPFTMENLNEYILMKWQGKWHGDE